VHDDVPKPLSLCEGEEEEEVQEKEESKEVDMSFEV
jgi:hypothetical protein